MVTADEISNIVYQETIDLITEQDSVIVMQAIAAAEEEVKSYLRGRYDVDAIFLRSVETVTDESTGQTSTVDRRNAMLVEIVKVIAVWHVIMLCNADMIYDQWRERYDRAVTYLKAVSKGDVSPDLPILVNSDGVAESPIKLVGNHKFNHYL